MSNIPQESAVRLLLSLKNGTPEQVEMLTVQEMRQVLPFFLEFASHFLIVQYGEGLRAEIVLKRWNDYIEVLKKKNRIEVQQLPLNLWDLTRFNVALVLLESLNLDTDTTNHLKDSLLTSEEKQELSEFCEELELVLSDQEIETLTASLDWKGTISEDKLIQITNQMIESQQQHLFKRLEQHWNGVVNDIFHGILLIALVEHTKEMMIERWAKLIEKKVSNED